MNPRTGQTWGARSDRDELPHVDVLGENVGQDYDWGEFDALKATSFATAREPVFHYVISAHGDGDALERSTGLLRGIDASACWPGAGAAGAGSFRFGGRIGGKALKPGRYVLVATPPAADGRAGEPRQARFRIAR